MQWVKPRPCPFRFKYYVFYIKNTTKKGYAHLQCSLFKKNKRRVKKVPHTIMHHMIWKKNGLPGSCTVFVPQTNIIIPCGSSKEIQEQEFPEDFQENFITVAIQLATLLCASVFLKERKKNIADVFRVWNHFQLFDFGQIDHSDVMCLSFNLTQWWSNGYKVFSYHFYSVFWKIVCASPIHCHQKRYSILNNYTGKILLLLTTFFFFPYVGLFIFHLFI